jgi:hypothetical protein
MAAVSLFVIAQRAIFGNPFLMGRTASFLLPLFILFFLFFLRDLGRLGGGWRPAAGLLLAAAVALSAAHWVRTANLTQTMTWAYDADTKRMITDVVSLHAESRPASSRWRLGVDWLYWPATEYYRRAGRLTWLDVSMLPTARRCDLFYLPGEPGRIGARVVVKNYPLTGNVLAK